MSKELSFQNQLKFTPFPTAQESLASSLCVLSASAVKPLHF
jgi:hypothetical protein